MTGTWRSLALGMLVLAAIEPGEARAQITVTGGRKVVVTPATPIVEGAPVPVPKRLVRRSRNPYFVARPVYPPTPPGARANVTFEPFTRWYYPNSNSYYPPVSPNPSIRTR
jgi:hypothetical protein